MELNDKLQVLRDVMLDVITKQKPFDMDSWVDLTGREVDCNTASCAYGWLARDPRGQALGLGLKYLTDSYGRIRNIIVTYKGEDDFGDSFIGDENIANFLFMPGSYWNERDDQGRVPPKAVIQHIDHLLAGRAIPHEFLQAP